MVAVLEADVRGRRATRIRGGGALLMALALLAWATLPVSSSETKPLVLVADVNALVHPVSAEYMVEAMDRADAEGAALLVFVLETPGGLVDSTRTIVTRMLAAKTPVAVFVAPSGARAASAGFLITLAADVAAMAPGTHIGAAHPVSGQGEKMDETMSKKAASDVAAYARTLAAGRGRNVEWAEQAVNESRAFTETEALNATPPLVDLVASDVPDLLGQLDGWVIKRFDGRTETLWTAGARVESLAMSFRQRVLSTLAHPNIAYILLSLGVLGLTIELWSPGAILPGVVGGICLLLAFFTFQVLPVNYAGVLLILFGLTLLVLEIKVTSFGLLGAGGVVSLLLGSMILIDAPAPELRVSLSLILPVVAGLSAILLFLVRLAVISQRRPSVTGASGMVGAAGVALTPIPAGGTGRVSARGEIWTARSADAIPEGEAVLISGLDGLMLDCPERTNSGGAHAMMPHPLLIVAVIIVMYVVGSIKILAEYERGVIFRLGKLLPEPKGPGVILVFAPIDRMVRVGLRTVVMDVPPQDIITHDNVSVKVNAVVYFRVVHPQNAIVQVENYHYATSQLAQTTLRSVLGQVSLDDLLSERDRLNAQLAQILDQHTDAWGIKVSAVEVKHVDLPENMQRAMARQAEAEREKRAKIIHAAGELEASEKLAQAAHVIASAPEAMTLRYLQTLTEIAAEKNSTIIFPLPIDLIRGILSKT